MSESINNKAADRVRAEKLIPGLRELLGNSDLGWEDLLNGHDKLGCSTLSRDDFEVGNEESVRSAIRKVLEGLEEAYPDL